jgi:hypothetical protein
MKKYIVLVTFLCGFFAMGQGLLERNVGDFHEIKVYDLIAVNLIKSNDNKVMIKVRMMLEKKFQGENTFVEVYYKDLDVIDGNEGARITANELIAQTSLNLRVQEGAEIRLGLEVDYLSSKAVTGGIIEVSGMVDVHDVNMNTGAILRAKELRSSITNIRLTAGGEAAIFATKRVDINVRAGGDVDVYGNPKEVTKKQFAGGRIRFRS